MFRAAAPRRQRLPNHNEHGHLRNRPGRHKLQGVNRTWNRTAFAALLLAAPAALLAYGTAVHDLLPREALGAQPSIGATTVARDTLPGVTDADLGRFRAWVYDRARTLPDTSLRRRFLARYPTSTAFDPGAWREFLMIDRNARAMGVDSFGEVRRALRAVDRRMDPHRPYASGERIALAEALQLGSIYPDLDRRNQDRLLRDAAGRPVLTSAGDSIPFDPMTLNMGKLTGLSSQAGAHYGLNRTPKSSDPATLRTAPWNFAVAPGFPGPVETYGPDNAQLYTDLALLAALGAPGGRTLSAFYAGNAFHYIADVGNAVHTVQVGIYPIFVDATVQYWLRRIVSLFGLIEQTKSRNAIGIDILTNLHTFSEHLYQAQLLEALGDKARGQLAAVPAPMRGALTALETGDDSLARVLADTVGALARAGPSPAFGRAIAVTLVDATVRDGAEVYRITRDIVSSRLRSGSIIVDFDTVPDARIWRFVRVKRGAMVHTELDDFDAVHHRGIARTTSALRAWWAEYRREAAVPARQREAVIDAVMTRLVRERLDYLDAADARRARWIASHGGPAR